MIWAFPSLAKKGVQKSSWKYQNWVFLPIHLERPDRSDPAARAKPPPLKYVSIKNPPLKYVSIKNPPLIIIHIMSTSDHGHDGRSDILMLTTLAFDEHWLWLE